MKSHQFTLILRRMPAEAKVDRFYGICQDATVVVSAGVARVHFQRRADSLEQALCSALADIRTAKLTVQRVEMEPDTLRLPA